MTSFLKDGVCTVGPLSALAASRRGWGQLQLSRLRPPCNIFLLVLHANTPPPPTHTHTHLPLPSIPLDDADCVLVMHGINRMWEVFAATKDGQKIPSSVKTKIPNYFITQRMGFDMWAYKINASLATEGAAAFYDKKDDRYVIMWLTSYQYAERINISRPSTLPTAPIVVCASEDANALGRWNCWALDPSVHVQPEVPYCAGYPVQNLWVSASSAVRGVQGQAVKGCWGGCRGEGCVFQTQVGGGGSGWGGNGQLLHGVLSGKRGAGQAMKGWWGAGVQQQGWEG